MPIAVNDVNTQSHSVKVGIADAYYYDYGGYTSRCCRSQPKARCQYVSPMICPLSTWGIFWLKVEANVPKNLAALSYSKTSSFYFWKNNEINHEKVLA
mgnify:CR=1 FL=1